MLKQIGSFFGRYFLISIMGFFLIGGSLYYLWLHRYPFTQNAFVTVNVRTVSPLVSGYIEKIHVKNNTFVRKGTPLITIYQPPYSLKTAGLKHSIASLNAKVKSLEEQKLAAEASADQAGAQFRNAQYLAKHAVEMYNASAVSQQYAEEKERSRAAAEAALNAAIHTVESFKHEILAAKETLKSQEKELEIAEIALEQTVVYALSDGYVMNMNLSPGAYTAAGTALFAFADTSVWFLQANFQETELPEIRAGLPARIWLWQYPGLELHGVVESVGWGVERRLTSSENAMPQVQNENEWFLLPQRYPVQIRLTEIPDGIQLHPGGSAFVQIPVPARPFRQFIWRLFQI